jgi:hypothetical protein
MTIEMILLAFEALRDGTDNPDDPLQECLMQAFEEAEPEGLTVPELVEALLGRELTIEEENIVLLRTETAEGHG